MKNALLIFLIFTSVISRAEDPATTTPDPAPATAVPAAVPVEESDWGRRRLKLRAGRITQNTDYAVANSWELKPENSHQASVGYFWNFPKRWQRTRFFYGGEFKYLQNKVELSGSSTASIDSQIMQLMGVFGIELRPHWFSPFGMTFALDWQLWGEKNSKLNSGGFSQDLGKASPVHRDVVSTIYALPVVVESGIFWEVSKNWRPAITVDTRETGAAVTLGVDYVF